MKKTFMSLAVTALLGLSGVAANAAAVYPDFTINEASVPGSELVGETITADKINGFYKEKITLTSNGSGGFTFASAAYANLTAFASADGTLPVESLVGTPDRLGGYSLYAVFTSNGYVAGPTSFIGTDGIVRLYIDPKKDTVGTVVDGSNVTRTGTSDDYEIAFSINLSDAVGNSGSPSAFNFVFSDFQLTDAGKLYFTSPSSPFYQLAIVNGDFDNITIAPGTTDVTGDLSAVFSKIPEPGSLALLGLGLAGLGFTQRRRNLSK